MITEYKVVLPTTTASQQKLHLVAHDWGGPKATPARKHHEQLEYSMKILGEFIINIMLGND